MLILLNLVLSGSLALNEILRCLSRTQPSWLFLCQVSRIGFNITSQLNRLRDDRWYQNELCVVDSTYIVSIGSCTRSERTNCTCSLHQWGTEWLTATVLLWRSVFPNLFPFYLHARTEKAPFVITWNFRWTVICILRRSRNANINSDPGVSVNVHNHKTLEGFCFTIITNFSWFVIWIAFIYRSRLCLMSKQV
jgi:hypothetical protein